MMPAVVRSFIPSFDKYLLNTCCVSGAVVKETMVSEKQIPWCNINHNLESGALGLPS